ncbi:MAG: DUF1499 domain-containing protein [Paracoccaceae bacterium]
MGRYRGTIWGMGYKRPIRSARGRRIASAVGALLVFLAFGGLIVRGSDHDPARWHVDPTTATRSSSSNDFMAAPSGATAGEIDLALGLDDPQAALVAFDRAARVAPRTQVVAGSVEAGHVTYVQRSRLIGFPDYVSVKRVAGGLAIWSRARYGLSDFGVNERRVRGWLSEAGLV